MNPVAPRIISPVWQRRLAKTPLRRRVALVPARAISTSSPLLARSSLAPAPTHPPAALSALLARLALPPSPALHPAILACLTHPSYIQHQPAPAETSSAAASASASASTSEQHDAETGSAETSVEAAAVTEETNELLASLGNTLLGLFTSEHLATRYPHLPTSVIKSAVTSYVGPASCVSVGRELGLGVVGSGTSATTSSSAAAPRRANAVVGVPIRWRRAPREHRPVVETPVAPGFRERVVEERSKRKESWDEGVASVVRAFVGLIFQEQGIHAAREFVHAHFLSRHVDLSSLLNFRKPKYVLSSVVSKHLADAGVPASVANGQIQSRVLASTGVNTQAPLFNIGLFLNNGLKLAEGHGSSLAMAEHRAATNALLSLFLVRSDNGGAVPPPLPTSARDSDGDDGDAFFRADETSRAATFGGASEALVGLASAGLQA